MGVCLQCRSRLVAGTAACVVCGHPRLGALPGPLPQRQVVFGGASVLTMFVLTVMSQVPLMLILYLAPSHDGGRHCAEVFFVTRLCGAAGAMVEIAFWVVPYLFALAGAILLAQKLTEPSRIGPFVVATAGFMLPWMYAASHVFGAFSTS